MTQRCEQETIISRMADEDHWQVYTCDRVVKARVLKLAEKAGLGVRQVDDVGIEVLVPKDWVKIRAPRRVTEETRAKARSRALSNGFGVMGPMKSPGCAA